jgi:hypothetical protein
MAGFQRDRRIAAGVCVGLFAASFAMPRWFVAVAWVWLIVAGGYLWRRYPHELLTATFTDFKRPVGLLHIVPWAIVGTFVVALLIVAVVR